MPRLVTVEIENDEKNLTQLLIELGDVMTILMLKYREVAKLVIEKNSTQN